MSNEREDRIDHLEGLTSGIAQDYRQLLTAQILINDALKKTNDVVSTIVEVQLVSARESASKKQELDALSKRTDQRIQALVDAGHHTDERLNTLIAMMDEWIRHSAPPQ